MISRLMRVAILGCMISVALTGCWDIRTANQYVIVSSAAVMNGEKSNYHVYLQIINTMEFVAGKRRGDATTYVLDGEGNTMNEAFFQIEQKAGRKLELSHTMLLMLDEKLLSDEKGLLFFDFLESMADIRNDIQMVVAHRIPASDLNKIVSPSVTVSAGKIRYELDSVQKNWGGTPNVHLREFIRDITSEGKQPMLSSVTIEHPSPKAYNTDVLKSTVQPTQILVDGTAVMKRAKLLGFLSVEETRDLLWAQNKLKLTSLTVPCESDQYMQVQIKHSTSDVNVNYANHRPIVRIRIFVEGDVTENQCQSIRLDKMNGFNKADAIAERMIKQSVEGTIQKVQKEYGVDIFGFGERLMRTHYRMFNKVKNDWDQQFAQAEVKVAVKAKIQSNGIISKSFLNDIPE
ncbi:germination protein, Ger(x)C family [Paenibacillus curdlanolyticus YK9]|uniref:Germination protein, Ger(X)C family n=1 Tax=Paenibacillus curdlanolyticus YK9 TaxID=717606 RepID=E0I7Q3_9BACL|nr:Ger(x)C family spore germination protein [Paenibacillus curdlanolyticus]EFM11208.1 germination protein, Ger(x)C family [Paenibacillus curdlanolyticus YK9]